MVMKKTIFIADTIPEALLLNIKPDYNMAFHKDDQEIGRMEWNDGVMKFTGKAEESAKVFFEYLKPLMDDYLKK